MFPAPFGKKLRNICLIILFVGAGCREAKQVTPPPPSSALARVGDVSISQADFERLLQARAGENPERYATVEAKAALLDEMIRREAIYAKARAAGFDQRSDIQESVKRLIVDKYQDEQLASQDRGKTEVSEQNIKAYYDEHLDKFTTPAAVRASVIFIKIPATADADKQAALTARAQSILDRAKSASPTEFALLAQQNSDDQASRYRAGDIGWVSTRIKNWDLDPELASALLALKNPGDFAPLLLTGKGAYIAEATEIQSAQARPLAEVKDAIAYNLAKEAHEQKEKTFYASMKEGIDISIDRSQLEAIKLPSLTSPPPELPRGLAQAR